MDEPQATPRPAVPRPARLTSRAAVLAVVICAIALSLAYPVREYVAQRRQVDQLVAEQQLMRAQVRKLTAQGSQYTDPGYIKQQAEQQLHMCLPQQRCYVVVGGAAALRGGKHHAAPSVPWYAKLWRSVRAASKRTGTGDVPASRKQGSRTPGGAKSAGAKSGGAKPGGGKASGGN